MEYFAGKYDVIVVGAGHAGCEAALAAARLNCKTLLITINLDRVAHMPCNPSIGGPAKGHLVREIDALGGQMGIVADETSLQARLLNTGKGPAVQAFRIQSDKKAYSKRMLEILYAEENLTLLEALIEKIIISDSHIKGVVTRNGAQFEAENIIITSGTYLRGKIIIGETIYEGGPSGDIASVNLSRQLKELNIELDRFKTGTPPRINKRSVDFTKFVIQPGDNIPRHFSFLTPKSIFWGDNVSKQLPCWLGYTSEKTHSIIKNNLHRAPLFTGVVEGIGPRYCPSIEDKVVRFANREAHQIFLEPEGYDSDELYAAGLSTSLPEEIQLEFFRSISGLENVEFLRPGYAIEYDYVKPYQLSLALEVKAWPGLFTAGQINGTSGYEEAAAQGLMAGINAAMKVKGKDPFILRRSDGYLGVLVDDLVNKDVIKEPYRLFTSRAEYRLILRQDNADLRLTEKGRNIGLVSDERWLVYKKKVKELENINSVLNSLVFSPTDNEVQNILLSLGSSLLKSGLKAADLIKRPEILSEHLQQLTAELKNYSFEAIEESVIQIKYKGYIDKQMEQIIRFNKMEDKILPTDIDYSSIRGLANEAKQRLIEVFPHNIGQASRISGVNPSDISVLLIYLEQRRRGGSNV
ncbi:MAG: tRNA uridine-5-carboxymethylaminomethyl(34) synthesis enzyme MnmG [Eubacteriales bacterium]